jgi:hypothetical protein
MKKWQRTKPCLLWEKKWHSKLFRLRRGGEWQRKYSTGYGAVFRTVFVDIFVVSFVALLRSSQNSTKAFLRNYERWGG